MPKGPEEYSPTRHPERALRRRNLVLNELLEDKKITAEQAAAGKAAPLGLHVETPVNTEAPYFVEEVRRQLERDFGVEEAHGAGLRVYTTLDIDLQRVANKAVLDETAAYERRHGWKAKLPNVLNTNPDLKTYVHPDWTQRPVTGAYLHGLVVDVSAAKMTVKLGSAEAVLTPADWVWTQKVKATDLARVGDVVYVRVEDGVGPGEDTVKHATLQQDSGAQASLMAVDNANGEVLAMVGGRDFALSQFNRATQAQRQVGSSFKPYVYTTAIEGGMKPSDTVLDTPTSFYTPNGPYTPHNYEPDYKGAMSLTEAFAESRNIPALRLANKFGITKVIEVAHRFGITSNIPAFLPVAIGSADITLAEQVGAYSVFPNDGIRIAPHYVRKVVQADGSPMQEKTPEVREVISLDTARTMLVLLQAVTSHGTAATTNVLKHALGGKTGTTNDYTDAWFVGFSPSVTCGTWMGFDDRESLGSKETGAKAALPMWIDFMRAAIVGKPDETFAKPNAPKKVLDLPPTTPDDAVLPKPPSEDEMNPDAASPDDDATPKKAPTPTPVPSTPALPVTPAQPATVPRSAPAAAPSAAAPPQ